MIHAGITVCVIFGFMYQSVSGCLGSFETDCDCRVGKIFQEKGRLVSCTDVITLQSHFPVEDYPSDIISLELTGCKITNISKLFPYRQSSVENILQLILAHNEINYILPETFRQFHKLQLLNLSYNNIAVINGEMFQGLVQMHTLYLDHNSISVIPGTAFVNRTSLKTLDLTSNNLICNCLMHDFAVWCQQFKKKKGTELIGSCLFPRAKTNLKRLKPKNLKTCEILKELPFFELYPSQKQVVFEGDNLPLTCEGTNLPTSKITWMHNDVIIPNKVGLSTKQLNQPKISGYLDLGSINGNSSGIWSCTISSNYSLVSDQIDMLVVNQNAEYCPNVIITNDLGHFVWPETVYGITTFLPCNQPLSVSGVSCKASRTCMNNGLWNNADYSQCQLSDDFARTIKNFIEKNITEMNALEECNKITNILLDVPLNAVIGLKYLKQLMSICLINFPEPNKNELRMIMTELMSKASTVGFESDNKSFAYFKTIHQLFYTSMYQQLQYVTLFIETSSNVAVFGETSNTTKSIMICTSTVKQKMKLKCRKVKRNDITQQNLVIRINLPTTVDPLQKVFVANYRNGKTFQSESTRTVSLQHSKQFLKNKSDVASSKMQNPDYFQYKQHVIISNVYAITINNQTRGNLSFPAKYVFSTQERVSAIKAAYGYYIALWDGEDWQSTQGWCHFNHTAVKQNDRANYTVAICTVFGTIAIMKNIASEIVMSSIKDRYQPVLHPVAFVGSGCLAISLLIIFFTYFLFPQIKISRDARHMLLNQCVHFFIAIMAFALGIWRVHAELLCYTTGILLHYSSMSILLWITISSRNICKEMLILQNPPTLEPKPSRPMLRFYLIGCGIPIIVCGITAAAKIQNYNGDGGKYCWLSWETSLYAFYGPSALIAIYCIIVLLRVLATLNCTPNSHLRNDRQKNYGTDAINLRSTCNGLNDDDSCVVPLLKDIENEQSYRSRLRGVSLTLVFFIATWTAAALSVAAPHIQELNSVQYSSLNNPVKDEFVKYMNVEPEPDSPPVDLRLVFSCIFSVFAIFTAVFLFVQQLVTREDVCMAWKNRCMKPCVETKSLQKSDACGDSRVGLNLKTTNERRRQDTATTAATDPITMETALNTASLSGDITPAHHLCASHHSSNFPRSSNNSTSRHCDSSYVMYSSMSRHNKLSPNDNHYGIVQDSNRFGEECHLQHHLCQESYLKNRTKPIKLTNLQHQYDSLTEHSFEEGHNMHTIPVILQHQQRKLDNGALYNRYQRMRKVLEAKKRKPPRLTVLREHAQDSLTSDDGKTKSKKAVIDEQTSLLSANRQRLVTAEVSYVPNFDIQEKEIDNAKCSNTIESSQNAGQVLLNNEQDDAKGIGNPNLIAFYNKPPETSKWKSMEPVKDRLVNNDKHEDLNGTSTANVAGTEGFGDGGSSVHRGHCYLTAGDVLGLMHVPPKLDNNKFVPTAMVTEFDPLVQDATNDDILSLDSSQPQSAEDYMYASLRNETSV